MITYGIGYLIALILLFLAFIALNNTLEDKSTYKEMFLNALGCALLSWIGAIIGFCMLFVGLITYKDK